MAREMSLEELLKASFAYQMEDVYTAIPGIVVAVNLAQMSVDVQPTINDKRKDSVVKERPVIMNVPLQYPVSKSSGMTYPLVKGDSVLLIFSMRGIDIWKRGNGYPTTPSNFRKFSNKDCIAIPGVVPFSESPNNPQKHVWPHDVTDTVMFHGLGTGTETEVRLKAGGGVIINTNQFAEVNCKQSIVNAETVEINANSMDVNVNETTWNGNIQLNGNLTQMGTYTLASVNINLHTHPGVQSGPSNTGPPQ